MASILQGSPSITYLLIVRWRKAGRPHESCCKNPNSCQPHSVILLDLISNMSLRQENKPAVWDGWVRLLYVYGREPTFNDWGVNPEYRHYTNEHQMRKQ